MTAFRSDSPSDDGRPVPGESAPSSGDRDTTGAEAEGPSTQTSVYLVDDHPPIRDAIRRALGSTIDLRVCGHAGTLAEARRGIDERDPGVVVVDISLPDGHGLDLVQALCEQRPAAEVVVFSMHDETIYAERAIRAGAAGYLMKTEPLEELIEAIRRAEQGEIYLSEAITTTVLSSGRGGAAPRLSFAIDELSGGNGRWWSSSGRGSRPRTFGTSWA